MQWRDNLQCCFWLVNKNNYTKQKLSFAKSKRWLIKYAIAWEFTFFFFGLAFIIPRASLDSVGAARMEKVGIIEKSVAYEVIEFLYFGIFFFFNEKESSN